MSTNNNKKLDFLKPKPLKYKKIFKKHGVKLIDISTHLGIDYNLLTRALNGKYKLSEDSITLLDSLVEKIEEQ